MFPNVHQKVYVKVLEVQLLDQPGMKVSTPPCTASSDRNICKILWTLGFVGDQSQTRTHV